jgi:ribosomal protein S18 acetylase RimI-like enzyme
VSYVVDLARKHTDALGFIPRPRLEQYHAAGQIHIARENGDPCGYLVVGSGWPNLKIYQACIQYDVQRREHGWNLVNRLERQAARMGYEAISLWCGDDLAANEFWKACAFVQVGQKAGGERRGRKLNLWVKRLCNPLEQRLWERIDEQ